MELEKELEQGWELEVAARLLMKREVQQMYLYLRLHGEKYEYAYDTSMGEKD